MVSGQSASGREASLLSQKPARVITWLLLRCRAWQRRYRVQQRKLNRLTPCQSRQSGTVAGEAEHRPLRRELRHDAPPTCLPTTNVSRTGWSTRGEGVAKQTNQRAPARTLFLGALLPVSHKGRSAYRRRSLGQKCGGRQARPLVARPTAGSRLCSTLSPTALASRLFSPPRPIPASAFSRRRPIKVWKTA